MSGHVLVCFALPGEAKPFKPFARTRPDLTVLVTGMGAKNAESEFRRAIAVARPSRVFTCGVAGALDPALNIGNVLYQTTDTDAAARLARAGARAMTFCCSQRVAVTIAEKAALRAATNAAAVEMESAIIADMCARLDIPCAIVRAISDDAHEDFPLDINRALDADSRISPLKLGVAIATAPWKIPALLRLGRNSALAARRLAQVLENVV